jgi:anti-sigma-K factor RskA
MRGSRPEPHTLAGAYALDALAGADRARFERHLARCQQCAQEISGLREATARLAAAAAAEPPPGLTERALAAAARTRQLPPATPGSPAPWSARHPSRARLAGSRSRAGALLGRAWMPRLALAAAGLRVLPSSQCYELWLMGPGGDKPAGMLPEPRQGMTGPVIASGLTAGDHLGLTIEPAGGAPHPSTPMILAIAL